MIVKFLQITYYLGRRYSIKIWQQFILFVLSFELYLTLNLKSTHTCLYNNICFKLHICLLRRFIVI